MGSTHIFPRWRGLNYSICKQVTFFEVLPGWSPFAIVLNKKMFCLFFPLSFFCFFVLIGGLQTSYVRTRYFEILSCLCPPPHHHQSPPCPAPLFSMWWLIMVFGLPEVTLYGLHINKIQLLYYLNLHPHLCPDHLSTLLPWSPFHTPALVTFPHTCPDHLSTLLPWSPFHTPSSHSVPWSRLWLEVTRLSDHTTVFTFCLRSHLLLKLYRFISVFSLEDFEHTVAAAQVQFG